MQSAALTLGPDAAATNGNPHRYEATAKLESACVRTANGSPPSETDQRVRRRIIGANADTQAFAVKASALRILRIADKQGSAGDAREWMFVVSDGALCKAF